jgi:hypothetical protein
LWGQCKIEPKTIKTKENTNNIVKNDLQLCVVDKAKKLRMQQNQKEKENKENIENEEKNTKKMKKERKRT